MTRRPRSSSSSFSTKKFDVFEFNDEDHSIEKVSKRILRKFKNPSKSRSSPVTKYDFLQAFASGSNCRPVSIDITADHINLDDEQEEEVTRCSAEELADQPLEVVTEVVDDDDGRGHDDGYDREKNDTQSLIDTPLPLSADKEISGCSDFVESEFDSKNRSLGVASDDNHDDASQMSYSSTSSSNPPEDEVDFGDQLVDHEDSAAFVINVEEKVVDVIPDFIQFEDLYSTRSQLTFSCNSLKLEGSTSNGTRETLKIEWPTEDIIKIESCWFENIETALINLLLKSKDYSEDGNTNQNPVHADFKLLKFAVYDSFWYKAEEAIKLLDTRYTDIWSTRFNIDVDNSGNISALGQHYFFSQNRYFPNFDEAFDEVIYPKGEPDAVSISKRDVELLQPQTFINDTIIDFYIKYLKNKLPTDEQDRFHFFNSFFFRKLADLDKDPASACDGRAAFQRVRKWTRKVNLFEKDYILIPINYSLHWSLIAICHPGEVTCYQGKIFPFSYSSIVIRTILLLYLFDCIVDEEMNESSKIPCILHMDSLQGTHKGLKNIFQSYLCEEWKERHGNVVDDVSSKFLHMRFISLELPQQDNLYDCGLFLLHYVERFLEEAPVNFNPFMITKFSDFLSSNWFPPPEASLKRSHIQNLIYDIFENNSLQARPTDCLDKGLPSEDPAIVVQTKVEEDSLTGCSYSDLWCVKDPLNSSTELETADIQYPTASPGRVSPCMGGHALVSKDWRVISRSDCLQMSACHKRGFLSPLKEIDECSEETAVSVEREKSQLVCDFPSTSYVRKDHGASESSQHGLSVNFMKAVDDHSLSRTCTRLSSFPMNTSTHEDQLLKKNDESKIEDKTIVEYPSTSGEELTDYVVPDSPAPNDADKRSLEEDTKVNKEQAVTFESDGEDAKKPILMNAYVVPDSLGADDEHDADISIVESPSSFREYEPDAKRPKLMNQDGAPRRMLTRSMLKGACVL